jgi:hypothetical protein
MTFDPRALLGTWHILLSTFPMWRGDDRENPRFHYGELPPENGAVALSDRVSFHRGGKEREILGIDVQDAAQPNRFVWKGKGLLRLFSSRWAVEHLHPGGEWALISFEATLVTPAGIDVITRAPALPEASAREAIALLAAHPELNKELDRLFHVGQCGVKASYALR